ncbi:DUF4194 domain-containing protein [Cellvibrio japonicus]|uniref:DUF4194 domain-containing protein n=1 Tax=Cellvibrio japonicus (strain Ueda107) TaxID=498211 RepID=B3PE76_CELJU|nr:DUF4194 domain-containing protein [Cellvibrio japonicus]ACE83429.1 conserved hypothetical protein [Cellvibrio japonicus Ueda107]QEI12118.1 DUF4194 domain-containing protein [Cellvibrio japonicus]QEI15692.1 DUF4194 domain-containing protein [Cellvibrio japonicus]QEI19270.1 DUF4194 domain-containing protein [Cellvibrio japonicus]
MAGIFDHITGQPGAPNAAEDAPITDVGDHAPPTETSPLSDVSRTHKRLRDAAQELLKYGLLEEAQKPNLYRIVTTHVEEVSTILEPLDLALGLDEVRGLVYLRVRQDEAAEQDDDWAHPLVRRQRLNLEQSLLVAILRQHFIAYEQESGTGAGEALIAVDELIPQLQVYLGDLGSDARERTRVIQLLDQLKGHGLVSSLDAHERVTIRPIIAHLANPESLQALLAWLREQAAPSSDAADGKAAGEEDNEDNAE